MAQPDRLFQKLADDVEALKDHLQTSQTETTALIKTISEQSQRYSKSFNSHAQTTRLNEKSQELLKQAQASLQERDDKVHRLEKEKWEFDESLQAARSEVARLLQENTRVRKAEEIHKKNAQLEKDVKELSTYSKKLLADRKAAGQERDALKAENDILSKALEAAQSELKEIKDRQAENEAYLARLNDVVQSRPLIPTASADGTSLSKRSDSQQTISVLNQTPRKPLAPQSEAFSTTLASGTADAVLDDSAASLRGTRTATPSLSPHSKFSSALFFDSFKQTRQHGRSISRSSQDNVPLKSGLAGGAALSDDQLPEAPQTGTRPRTQPLYFPPPKKPSNSEARPSRSDSRTSESQRASVSGVVNPEYISVRGAADARQRQHSNPHNLNQTAQAYRVPRLLLCLECQRTGKQCDALEPCNNCAKSGMQCVRTLCPYFQRYGNCTNPRCLRVHDEEGYTTQRDGNFKRRRS